MTLRTPYTAVDIIIELYEPVTEKFQGIVLIERRDPPHDWALPGGMQEVGESLEQTAVREASEETGLDIELITQLMIYSDPERDPRGHVNSVGYVARAYGEPVGGDDALTAAPFLLHELPGELAFDHKYRIIGEYLSWKLHDRKSRLPT